MALPAGRPLARWYSLCCPNENLMRIQTAALRCLFFALIIFVPQRGFSEIISSDRRITWQGNVGISGDIPNRTTIYTTVSAGASTATIQAALSSCPANQVVKLAAGTYTLTTYLNWTGVNSGVVLRGAGVGSTIINAAAGRYFYMKGIFSESALSVDANLSADATKGGTTLTLSSVPSWVTVGDLIGVDQLDDSSFVSGGGTEGGSSYRQILGNGARGLGQLCRVTAKTATTITVELPLYYGFKTSKTAQIFQPGYNPSTNNPLTSCGIEDMTINGTGSSSGDAHMIKMENCDSCWVKNVEINSICGGAHIWTAFSYRCEIRHNYFHDSKTQAAGQGYGVALYHVSCGFLIEDNIFRALHNAQTINYGSSGNAYAYNYEANGTSDSNQNPGMNTHGTHVYMNLFEGNYCEDKVLADWTHGSSSHNTVFRCRITGENGNSSTDSYCATSIEYYNRYWNLVGNILGKTGQQNKYLEDSSSQSEGSKGSVLKVGGEVNVNNDFSPSDANSYTSGSFILVHGNYDTVTASQDWDSNVADHVLPNSYLYSRAPAFFASLAWPPFNPANPGGATVTSIPAGYRYVNGKDPVGPSAPENLHIVP